MAFFLVTASCEHYRPMPASDAALDATSGSADSRAWAEAAANLKHPLLPSVIVGQDGLLTPQGAAVVAVLQNPSLKAARSRRGVADAQVLQAGILPNPQLSASLDVPVAGATDGTINGFGVGATWDVTSLITRQANREAAAQQARSICLDVAWMEWQAAMGAKLHATRVLFLEEQAAELREQVKVAQESADRAEENAWDGFISKLERDATFATLEKRRAAMLAMEATLGSERALLNQSIGLPASVSVYLVPEKLHGEAIGPLGVPSATDLDRVIRDHRLDLAALHAGYDSQEAKLHSAVLSQFPRIGLGVTRARDTSDVGTLGFGITLDLPIFDRAQGRIAIEKATRQQLFDELAARTFDAKADAIRAYAELAAIAPQIQAAQGIETRLLAVTKWLENARGKGDADILQLNQARNDLADANIETMRLRQQEAELRIAVEVATGSLLGESQP